MVQKFTENDTKPELMGKVVIINPKSLRRKKRPQISYFTNIYNLISKHDTASTREKETGQILYSSDMLLNNPHRVETLTTL